MDNPTYSNPVWYRGYRIYLNRGFGPAYGYVHDDYDGAEDSRDNRCGAENSIAECKEAIDDLEDDQ